MSWIFSYVSQLIPIIKAVWICFIVIENVLANMDQFGFIKISGKFGKA